MKNSKTFSINSMDLAFDEISKLKLDVIDLKFDTERNIIEKQKNLDSDTLDEILKLKQKITEKRSISLTIPLLVKMISIFYQKGWQTKPREKAWVEEIDGQHLNIGQFSMAIAKILKERKLNTKCIERFFGESLKGLISRDSRRHADLMKSAKDIILQEEYKTMRMLEQKARDIGADITGVGEIIENEAIKNAALLESTEEKLFVAFEEHLVAEYCKKKVFTSIKTIINNEVEKAKLRLKAIENGTDDYYNKLPEVKKKDFIDQLHGIINQNNVAPDPVMIELVKKDYRSRLIIKCLDIDLAARRFMDLFTDNYKSSTFAGKSVFRVSKHFRTMSAQKKPFTEEDVANFLIDEMYEQRTGINRRLKW